ncbi:TonB-dependent receptor plug domain-containing protein, partial [Pantoea vagans]
MKKLSRLSLAIMIELGFTASLISAGAVAAEAHSDPAINNTSDTIHDGTMTVTAAEQTLQAPGVSTITADEIKKHPPARDVAEIIRTMPGVNLTGNSTSGQRGNNRQIDIRGMGPENTLIL